MDLKDLKANFLKAKLPSELVDQLLETYADVKKNYYLGRLRPNEVEGGRFAEAVFRILQFITKNTFTPLGRSLDTEKIILGLSNLPSSLSDSVRLHIPRTLRVVYDVRNNRDAAHLGDGIDPNLQDATLICACCDWVLAELLRLHHPMISPDQSFEIIENLVTRKAPIVQSFEDRLKTLNPNLKVGERLVVLLYHCGRKGATPQELSAWVKPAQKANLKTTLFRLEHDKDLIVFSKDRYRITALGEKMIEERGLLSPI